MKVKKPVNKRLIALIVGITVLATTGMVAAIVWLVFKLTAPMTDTTDRFLDLITQKQITQAYELTAPAFRQEVSAERFTEFLTEKGLDKHASHTWSTRKIDGTDGRVAGSFTSQSGRSLPLSIYLDSSSGSWLIVFIGLEPDTGD